MKFRLLSLIAVVTLAAPAVFAADFGVRVGRYNDANENFVGAEMLLKAGSININPNVEYEYNVDNATVGSANIDVTFDVAKFSNVTPYVGLGAGLSYVDDDFGTDTNVLGNAIAGVQMNFDFLKPYAQVKYFRTLDNNKNGGKQDDLAFALGLRF